MKKVLTVLLTLSIVAIIAIMVYEGRTTRTTPPVFEFTTDDFQEDGSLKKSAVPSGQQIRAALRSDSAESAISAMYVLLKIIDSENSKDLWPSDLSKQDVYNKIRRHLESEDEMVLNFAIQLADPKCEFGRKFYQSEKDIKRVQRAIKRHNEIQRKEKRKKTPTSWRFYELVLDDQGKPLRYKTWGGATVN